MPDIEELTAIEWLELGIDRGWCSEPVCDTHDGIPWTETEMIEWDQGNDPCATVVRINLPESKFAGQTELTLGRTTGV